MKARVLFYVQHLLGIGHLRRAELLVAAMALEGLEATVALGSRRIPEIPFATGTILQLPPAGIAGDDFSVLINEHGDPVDEAWKAARREALFRAVHSCDPDVVLFELFPFGRRQFRFELLPLLEMLHAMPVRPKIVSSVRDILIVSSKPGRDQEMADIARRYFDVVLVHGDEQVVPFGRTFPPAPAIADLIRYTGYVAPPAPDMSSPSGRGEVLITAGGGATGAAMFDTAVAARPMTEVAGALWRFLTGPDLAEARFQELSAKAGPNSVVERFRPDLVARLSTCAVSISRAGYNTTMDILRSGARAVVVPFETGQETEQRMRADLLAERGLLTVVPESELTPERLASAVNEALSKSPRGTVRLDGAAQSARLLAELAAAPRIRTSAG